MTSFVLVKVFGSFECMPSGVAISGYAKKLDVTSVFEAEAKALLEGLQVAWAKGFRMVEVESYNALLIEVVFSEHAASNGVDTFGSWLHIHGN
ncbi:hypothetical protein PVK06_038854 [Gossypium arboreum]|uniref:RNase H type-1 domain-containing protein n=1 Tax=Gossypium arboreum TaxID=29729 RepID=A0ABR0N1A7_GOSAR|nr:hypothetical protein PVK06_038854 [Gossypium arboreum]